MSNKYGKLASIVLVMGIALTGCSAAPDTIEQRPHSKPALAPTSTASATPTPAAEKQIEKSKPLDNKVDEKQKVEDVDLTDEVNRYMRQGINTAKDIDLDASFKNYGDASIEQKFPSSKFDTKAGARIGLDVLHELAQEATFYQARDTSRDFDTLETANFGDDIDAGFLKQLKKENDDEGLFGRMPIANEKGSLGFVYDSKKKKVDLTLAEIPVSAWNTPAVFVDGENLVVKGKRKMIMETVEGAVVEINFTYWVSVRPSGDSWQVVDMGTSAKASDTKVVSRG